MTEIDELIALGRDREAVEAARRRAPGGPMDGVQQLDQLMPQLEALVDGIEPGQLDGPTPCAGFTVAGVLGHMIGGATLFAPAFRGEAPPEQPGQPDQPTEDAKDLTDRWRRAMADLTSAVHSPGAQERTVSTPFGEMPGAVFARLVAFDGLVHGWDLAVSTGQPYDPDPGLVAEVDGFARQALGPELRDGDTFAAELEAPPDATPLERLAAFTGRRIPTKETQR